MIYELTHTTTYNYSGSVSLSHHVMRLRPRDIPRQHCLHSNLKVYPLPIVTHSHTDYFGNHVTFATIDGAHRKLVVTARNQVEARPRVYPTPEETPAWESVRARCLEKEPDELIETREFIYASPHIKMEPDYGAYAAPSFTAGRPVLEAVLDFTARLHRDFKFDPKATTVATPLEDVFKSRRGVCQDFAHLQIACLRSMGIPARYVSGYLETDPPPGKARLAGADASHAWLSFFCPSAGWIDIDPTNNTMPSTRHITVAWGRDYSDVSPIRGVILGGGEHSLEVSVDVVALPEDNL